jgi:hypothetical protein
VEGPLSASPGGVTRRSVHGILLPGPPGGVPHVGGVLRTPSAEHLEVDILLDPSNSRFPPPRTSGAVEIASSSTPPAARPWRIRSAPPPRETPAVAGELARLQQRGVEAVNEQEARTRIGHLVASAGLSVVTVRQGGNTQPASLLVAVG